MVTELRVLVVENDIDLRTMITKDLQGYHVKLNHQNADFAFSVEEAVGQNEYLKRMESGPGPDFFICGESVPAESFENWLVEVKQKWPACSVLILTKNDATIRTLTDHVDSGTDYLRIPFSRDELIFAITRACERRIQPVDHNSLRPENTFDIISIMAHELKAPLAAIEGYLQIVHDKTAGENPELYLQMISRSLIRAQGMRQLISDVLSLGLIQSGRKKPNVTEVDLAKVLRNSMTLIRPETDKRHITLHYTGPECFICQTDRSEMEIIFNNLLSNAVKYNVPDGKIEASLLSAEQSVKIVISDSGIGIPEEDCGKIFHEFVRIKNEKTRDIPGTGLGLCIVKKLVETHGGTILVKSAAGKGTTFTITLPKNYR